MNDWQTLLDAEPWLFPDSVDTVIEDQGPPGSWQPRSAEFEGLFSTLASILSRARITNLRINGVLHKLAKRSIWPTIQAPTK